MLAGEDCAFDGNPEPFAELGREGRAGALKHNEELFAAKAIDVVSLTDGAAQNVGHLL